MIQDHAQAPKRPWHRWLVGAVLIAQALFEAGNIAAALALGAQSGPPPSGLPDGAMGYYAALAPWEHVVGGVYVLLLLATGIGVMLWAAWARRAIAARVIVHVAYFGWHLATSTYLAVFGPVGFGISTALLLATVAYVFLLGPKSAAGR